jgi:hypothetical protein
MQAFLNCLAVQTVVLHTVALISEPLALHLLKATFPCLFVTDADLLLLKHREQLGCEGDEPTDALILVCNPIKQVLLCSKLT